MRLIGTAAVLAFGVAFAALKPGEPQGPFSSPRSIAPLIDRTEIPSFAA